MIQTMEDAVVTIEVSPEESGDGALNEVRLILYEGTVADLNQEACSECK